MHPELEEKYPWGLLIKMHPGETVNDATKKLFRRVFGMSRNCYTYKGGRYVFAPRRSIETVRFKNSIELEDELRMFVDFDRVVLFGKIDNKTKTIRYVAAKHSPEWYSFGVELISIV